MMASPVRIAHLIATNFLGGPERQILGHIARLDPSAFEAVAASFQEGGRPNEFLRAARAHGYPCWELRVCGKLDRAPVRRLRQLLVESDVALLCVHGYKAHVVGRVATRGLAVPVLPFVRGFTAENRRVRVYEWLDRQLLRRSPMAVAVSYALKHAIVRSGVQPARILVVQNAVDACVTTTGGPGCARDQTRASLGAHAGSRVVVSIGRLGPEKGHRYLVAAVPLIVKEVPEAKVVLVGDGVERSRIYRQIARLGVGDCVSLVGFRTDVPSILRAADVFVLPSVSEGLPNAALEALAARVPVVATAVGGTPEVVRHEQTGLLVPSKAPPPLADAIVRLLREPQLGARLAREGRRLIEREFTFEVQARKLEAAYHACIGTQCHTGKSRAPQHTGEVP